MRLHHTLTLAAALLAFGSCASIKVTNNTLTLPADSRVTIGEIHFDHGQWSKQDPEWIQVVEKQEAAWRRSIEAAFASRAIELGIDKGTAAEVRLRIRITDLEPGSKAARFWVGLGAGTGFLLATVDAGQHGSFDGRGEVTGGTFGGDIDEVFRQLGEAAAETAHESMQGS